MKLWLLFGGSLALSAAGLVALFSSQPFDRTAAAINRIFKAPPEWTQVRSLVVDADAQEVSRGERPLASFERLRRYWARYPGARRVLLVGNSQMISVSLAPNEPAPQGPEPSYADQLTRQLRERPGTPIACYRLAAPGMSYSEALWYAVYLSQHAVLRPDLIVLQLNYQSFWNGGVRAGMQELLQDAGFRRAIEQIGQGPELYAETFREALREYDERQARETHPARGVAAPPGAVLDRAVRVRLNGWPAWKEKRSHKDGFTETLYRMRVYLLGLKPSTARSITGARLHRSQAAIEAIARYCREQKIGFLPFNAPVNPLIDLYRTPADRKTYTDFASLLRRDYGVEVCDLERSIPVEKWGSWMGGPEPLHLSRAGHRQMTQQLAAAIQQALERR